MPNIIITTADMNNSNELVIVKLNPNNLTVLPLLPLDPLYPVSLTFFYHLLFFIGFFILIFFLLFFFK